MKEFLWELIKDPNFLGAFLGALITGGIALLTYWLDKRNERKKRITENKVLKKKYKIFYRTKCNQIINIAQYIKHDLSLLRSHNPYNIEPIDELKENITELKNIRLSLLDYKPDYVPLELYKNVEVISRYVDKMTREYSGILATEEEQLSDIMDSLESNSRLLIELIKNDLNKNFKSD